MILEHKNEKLGGLFRLTLGEKQFDWKRSDDQGLIHIIWNNSSAPVQLEMDAYPVVLKPGCILTSTYNHHLSISKKPESLAIFSFNREYYCIYDHDSEVSCNGIIFFGAQDQVIIHPDQDYQRKLSLLLEVFKDEFSHTDNIQGEMLVILLKRLIILCTRLAKKQIDLDKTASDDVEIVRNFNYLVDMHFREKKTVAEYADLMNRSPKTLSNVFSKNSVKSPLQVIHDRTVLEARRLLSYTDKSINEVAYELGYQEPAGFFKLFKKLMGKSPQNFRLQKIPGEGKIDSQ